MAELQNIVKLEFTAKDCNVAIARLAAASFGAELGFSLTDLEEIKVAVSEAVSNAMIHGYSGDESRSVEVIYMKNGDYFEITVKDDGVGIADIEKAIQPFFTTRPELERSGMGFTVMESFMDGVEVQSAVGHGTTVRLIKQLEAREECFARHA